MLVLGTATKKLRSERNLMQTFLPYPDFEKSAAVLDSRRLGSQIMEVNTLLGALHETNNGGYRNHVVTRMWAGHELALCGFGFACHEEWERRYKRRKDLVKLEEHMELASSGDLENMEKPAWFGRPEVHVAYQRLLLFKNYEHYSQYFQGVPAFSSADEFEYPEL